MGRLVGRYANRIGNLILLLLPTPLVKIVSLKSSEKMRLESQPQSYYTEIATQFFRSDFHPKLFIVISAYDFYWMNAWVSSRVLHSYLLTRSIK